MKAKEIRKMSEAELGEKLVSAEERLFSCVCSTPPISWKNPVKIAEVKRDIARVKTIIREQQTLPPSERRGKAKMSEARTSPVRPGSARSCPTRWNKTVVVAIEDGGPSAVQENRSRTYKLKAHDEENQCGIGDK